MKNRSIRNSIVVLFSMATLILSNNVFALDADLEVNAEVLETLTLTSATPLDFGTFALTAKASPGTRTIGGSDTNIDNVVTGSNGSVIIDGHDSQAISVSIPTSLVVLTESGGGATMNATVSLNGTVPTALDNGGAATISVTGVLTVNANQAVAADYTGTATVLVNY